MKRVGFGFVLLLVLLCSGSASAQRRFGLGAVVGQPSGFSAKYWLDGRNSLDGILGIDLGRHGGMLVNVDWVHHWADLTPVSQGKFLLGAGAGMYIGAGDKFGLGARVKGLADYVFAPAPVNIFLEVAPTVIFDDPGIGMQGGLGVRWFF